MLGVTHKVFPGGMDLWHDAHMLAFRGVLRSKNNRYKYGTQVLTMLCPLGQGLIGNVHRNNIKFLHAVNQLYRAYPQVLSVLKSWVRARGVLELLVGRLFLRGMRLLIRIVDCEEQLCWRFSEVVKNPRKWVRVGFITFRKVVTLGVANKVFPGGKSPGGGGGGGKGTHYTFGWGCAARSWIPLPYFRAKYTIFHTLF